MRLNQVTVGATDYNRSVHFYSTLGLTQIVAAPPRYARFETPGGETFSIHLVDQVAGSSTVVYFEMEGLDRKVARLKEAGLIFTSNPADKDWG